MLDANRADLPGCGGLPFQTIDPEHQDRLRSLYCNWLYKLMSAMKGKRDVAPEWINGDTGFLHFYRALAPSWFPGAQLSRRRRDPSTGEIVEVDGNLPYSPGTCEWATPEENFRDRQGNLENDLNHYRVESDWVTVNQVAAACGISPTVARARLRNGWNRWDDLLLPEGSRRKTHRVQRRYYLISGIDKPMSLGELYRYAETEHLPVTYKTISTRLESGVRDADALFSPTKKNYCRNTGRRYDIEGEQLTAHEIRQRVPERVRHLVGSRLSRGCRTWEGLRRTPREGRSQYRSTRGD